MKKLKGVCIGVGYFCPFQCEAWQRIPEVELAAVCDCNRVRAEAIKMRFMLPRSYIDYR